MRQHVQHDFFHELFIVSQLHNFLSSRFYLHYLAVSLFCILNLADFLHEICINSNPTVFGNFQSQCWMFASGASSPTPPLFASSLFQLEQKYADILWRRASRNVFKNLHNLEKFNEFFLLLAFLILSRFFLFLFARLFIYLRFSGEKKNS